MPQQPFAGGARRLAGAAGCVGGTELHGEAEDHLVTVVQHAVGRHALLGADGEHQSLAARLHLAHLPGATPTGYRGATQAQNYNHEAKQAQDYNHGATPTGYRGATQAQDYHNEAKQA